MTSDLHFFAARRARLAAHLSAHGGGVALVPTAPEVYRNADTHYPYRADSSFHYLTGFNEPQSWLLIDAQGRTAIFLREKNLERETWDGVRLGPQAAPAVLGLGAAHPVEQIDQLMPGILAGQSAVWFPFAHPGTLAQVEAWMRTLRSQARAGLVCPQVLRDVGPVLGEMRLIKDQSEIQTMRRAAHISAQAHVRAMQFCAAHFRNHGEGLPEFAIEAELLHDFRRAGAQSAAYPSIVAAGTNACVLHHSSGDQMLRRGELCLIDAGCELDGYASDITRTFPADGRFSSPQRDLYTLVLQAQDAAVAATRPGARMRDAHHAAVRVLSQGMLDLGLLHQADVGDVDAVIERAAYRQFYMHGTGHWLGRDVHDTGSTDSVDEEPVMQPDGMGNQVLKKPSRVLAPGMVVTIEPGIYVRPAPGVPEVFWGMGIRIEDDAVVTANGCELISRGVPVGIAEIEQLMATE